MRSASAPPPDAPPNRPTAPSGLPWPAIGLGFATLFTVFGVRAAFAVLYPTIVADMGWTVGEVTQAFSAGLFIYAPTALAIGFLVDRFGCRLTMLGGCGCLVAGMVVLASATQLWHLYVAFGLATGLGGAAIGFVAVVKLVSLRAPRRFAAAFGLAYFGSGVGAFLVSPIVQGVVERSGWRAGALTVAGLAAVGLMPLVLLLAPGRDASLEPDRPASGGASPRAWSPTFAVFFASNVLLGYLLLLPTHQVAHALDVGYSAMAAATAAGLWGALTSVGGGAGGWVLERWGSGRLLVVAAATFGVGTGALLVLAPEAPWLMALFVVAGGIGRGILGLPLVAAQTRAFAGARLGRFTGLLDLGYGVGAFLGPWLTGLVHDAGGSFVPGLASAIVAAIGVAVTTVVGSRLAEERRT